MELWTDFALTLNTDEILRGEGVDPVVARSKKLPLLVSAAESVRELGLSLLHPAAALNEARVLEHRHDQVLLESGKRLTGALVASHLAGAERVAVVVCTIGPELEQAANDTEAILWSLALYGLGNAAVEAIGQEVCRRLEEKAKANGLETSTPLFPGEPEWPVDVGQPQIFALLDNEPAGVRLSQSWMMRPLKSISFVIGIGQNMVQANQCELCSMQEKCKFRHD